MRASSGKGGPRFRFTAGTSNPISAGDRGRGAEVSVRLGALALGTACPNAGAGWRPPSRALYTDWLYAVVGAFPRRDIPL